VNELAIIFGKMGIDTTEVLEAAGTKWNFLPFRPGLVGGHCISVDPYYLTHKAEALGYHPQIILAGRRINDGMAVYVAGKLVQAMLKRKIQIAGSRVLVLGITFKENCPDLRNTRVIDVMRELRDFGVEIDCHDPLADATDALYEYDINLLKELTEGAYDAVLLAVPHYEYLAMGAEVLRAFGKDTCVFYDLKSSFSREQADLRL
jgi:UDP-N-acetyl-D-galactosamine dehydrogenase